jgi:hypothetical protein
MIFISMPKCYHANWSTRELRQPTDVLLHYCSAFGGFEKVNINSYHPSS